MLLSFKDMLLKWYYVQNWEADIQATVGHDTEVHPNGHD